MCFLEDHVFDFEQADLGGVLVFSELHGDVFDIFLQRWNGGLFKSVNAATGFFNFLRKKLHGLFDFRKFQHIVKNLCQLL